MKSHSFTSNSKRLGPARFAIECALFGAILFVLHAVFWGFRGARDLPRELATLDAALREARTEILYFGDSTLFMGKPGEDDARSTADMLQERLPGRIVTEISGPAAQLELYELLTRYAARRPGSTKTIIIPLNLRMLAPQLEDRSYRYFDVERAIVENDSALFRILYRPLSVFKAFKHRTASVNEFDDAPVLDGDNDLGPIGEFNPSAAVPVSGAQRARIIAFSYMFALHEDDLAMDQLEQIIDRSIENGLSPIFYVTPIDYESCVRDIGPRFTERVRENVMLLRERCRNSNVVFLDFSTALPASSFAWEQYPNEHLSSEGRRFVADRLAEALKTSGERSN